MNVIASQNDYIEFFKEYVLAKIPESIDSYKFNVDTIIGKPPIPKFQIKINYNYFAEILVYNSIFDIVQKELLPRMVKGAVARFEIFYPEDMNKTQVIEVNAYF